MMDRLMTILHRDGTITYWSVYEQIWRRSHRMPSDRELAAMPAHDRDRVVAHIEKHWGRQEVRS